MVDLITRKKLTSFLDDFYEKNMSSILNKAATGWIYTTSIDHFYIKENLDNETKKQNYETVSSVHSTKKEKKENKGELHWSEAHLESILNEKCIKKKYEKLKMFSDQENSVLTHDVFINDPSVDYLEAQKRTFHDKNKINILIIGAGASGLFLANIIKNIFASKIRLLLVDNRCLNKNIRKKFNRNWLTQLDFKSISKNIHPRFKKLIGSFGTNGSIGIHLNIFETILKLSCLAQGTNFFYSSEYNASDLYDEGIDIIFDATAGHLNLKNNFSTEEKNAIYNFEIPRGKNLEIKVSGTQQNKSFVDSSLPNLNFTLKPNARFHYPYFENYKIENNMLKITNIPSKFEYNIFNYLKMKKNDNKFFMYNGNLRDEINEALLIVNLTVAQANILSSLILQKETLESFYKLNYKKIKKCDKKLYDLLNFLISLDIKNDILINRPFIYRPYINLLNNDFINGKKIYPIGDSLFSGNPKMGNGLSAHIDLINSLVEEMYDVIN